MLKRVTEVKKRVDEWAATRTEDMNGDANFRDWYASRETPNPRKVAHKSMDPSMPPQTAVIL